MAACSGDAVSPGRGQVGLDPVDGVLDVLQCLVGRNLDLEHDRRRRHAVVDGRLEVIDAGYAGDGVLDLARHLRFEFGRRRARLGDADGNHRHVDVGKARDRQFIEGLEPEEDQEHEGQDRRDRIADRPG